MCAPTVPFNTARFILLTRTVVQACLVCTLCQARGAPRGSRAYRIRRGDAVVRWNCRTALCAQHSTTRRDSSPAAARASPWCVFRRPRREHETRDDLPRHQSSHQSSSLPRAKKASAAASSSASSSLVAALPPDGRVPAPVSVKHDARLASQPASSC